ncbi:unnamed protein product [Trichobilharzia regenti]|nr:unnamed protein product [Trichobilharzia regenti]
MLMLLLQLLHYLSKQPQPVVVHLFKPLRYRPLISQLDQHL